MIKTDREYKGALQRLKEEESRIEATKKELSGLKLSAADLRRALEPVQAFKVEVQEEVKLYEKLKKGDIRSALGMGDIGRMLIALRIAKGLTQSDLAEKLGVHVTQVSRDERNDYHGITLERLNKILETLGFHMCLEEQATRRHRASRRMEPALAT